MHKKTIEFCRHTKLATTRYQNKQSTIQGGRQGEKDRVIDRGEREPRAAGTQMFI